MRKNKKMVAIVVPRYKKTLSSDDQLSLKHLNKYLNRYDKFYAIPNALKAKRIQAPGFKSIQFPDYFFKNREAYNELLLTEDFYQKFTDYEYILIYQLDALVFSDQLKNWCQKGYDYIGAPLIHPRIGQVSYKYRDYLCGNGGFSLRKVKSFIQILKLADKTAKRVTRNSVIQKIWFAQAIFTGQVRKIWLKAPAYCYPFAEDGFWSFEAQKYDPKFNIAPIEESFRFAFERYPRLCFKVSNNQIPFGAHAWKKHDQKFWLLIINSIKNPD
ncbi:hypothetical protein A3J19_01855 [Candidatus Daviesbacteria bacterium RIFCSPLOWO2_02_FULL_41_8]|uniref:DUF5672 domain-containing protein n=3 Tax=Candidatus Daviesiibacteriota TaxID=1752718 RepID=A0A1F5NI00_9BACT|nr:MAG: hypothetical protein A2871_00890 [Candidatus Daviesbacteria bacterium RIFCSPHIGHO2_01_FULL_41_23]OGE32970.1 MAG: hypothetical protein A3D83_04875 [Candidatus Daviesbacteria bacterium RIFCSPHIGHO2_02_FULL_41_10]OGE62450.1 MAG: hypothetical protein A2967_01375 [Candidatus Daviesbacteria bacterium RIFCSPLOWO2_01_FULL_41_32]OGE77203.1 MAG: hypothetical protein A3J19_01855 [Candidatus Daviesbacteria bacterium RIFCSPLOWO2_02_FULL_41_8]